MKTLVGIFLYVLMIASTLFNYSLAQMQRVITPHIGSIQKSFTKPAKTWLENIYEINKLAFEEEEEAKIVNALRDSDELILSLIALIDEIAIGHIVW